MNEFDSIRITEKGDTLSFEMTNELADSSHEAIFFLIRATSALIASVTKDDADPKEVAEAFGKTFSRHIAQDIQDERDRRAEETGIDRSRMARVELGSANPTPEEVLLLADTYDAPQLLNYYCSMCCPIGRQNVKPCAVQEFDRVMMQALAALQGTDKISAAIISIAQDGRVDPGEDVQMGEILAYMKNVATAAEAMQLWIKKNLKGEACNGKK